MRLMYPLPPGLPDRRPGRARRARRPSLPRPPPAGAGLVPGRVPSGPRRQPKYLRRNALVVLGNVGDGRHPDVEAALRRALADPDPMLREHAAWAAERLDRRDL